MTKLRENNNNEFQNKTTTQQNYKVNNTTNKFHDNKSNSNMLPTGTLSFQKSQPIRPGDNMSVGIDTNKCFIGKQEKSIVSRRNQRTNKMQSPEPTIDEVMESIARNKNYPVSKEPTSNATDEDDAMRLFDQLFGLISTMSDWLEPDTTIVITKASL